MPRRAFHHAVALVGSGVFELLADTSRPRGVRLDQDPNAPPPEWMVLDPGVDMRVAEYSGVEMCDGVPEQVQAKVASPTIQYSGWQYAVTPDMICAEGVATGTWARPTAENVLDIDGDDDYDESG